MVAARGMWSVFGGWSEDGLVSPLNDLQTRCVLRFGAELALVVFGRRDKGFQGRARSRAAKEGAAVRCGCGCCHYHLQFNMPLSN